MTILFSPGSKGGSAFQLFDLVGAKPHQHDKSQKPAIQLVLRVHGVLELVAQQREARHVFHLLVANHHAPRRQAGARGRW